MMVVDMWVVEPSTFVTRGASGGGSSWEVDGHCRQPGGGAVDVIAAFLSPSVSRQCMDGGVACRHPEPI